MTQRCESGQSEPPADGQNHREGRSGNSRCDAASCSEATKIIGSQRMITMPSVMNHPEASSLSRPLRGTRESRKPPARSRRHPYMRKDTTTGSPSSNDATSAGPALIDPRERHDAIRDPNEEQQSQIRVSAGDENATVQTKSLFLSPEQQAAQARAIFANLVKAERACKTSVARMSSYPQDTLTEKHIQHITCLHVNLLYWHHEFLVQAQHVPTVSADFDAKVRCRLPRRMWKHGIESVLELLLHRTSAPHNRLVTFIYNSYELLESLMETVTELLDTWYLYLGNLSNYRMAIEDNQGLRDTWASVAHKWFVLAADRRRCGIKSQLYRDFSPIPSLRQLSLHSRGLMSSRRCSNLEDHLCRLFSPYLRDGRILYHRMQQMEDRMICLYANIHAFKGSEAIVRVSNAALEALDEHLDSKVGVYGVPMAILNITALFDFGSPDNFLRQILDFAAFEGSVESDVPRNYADAKQSAYILTSAAAAVDRLPSPFLCVSDFCVRCFNKIIQCASGVDTFPFLLPYVHVMLVFVWVISQLRVRRIDDDLCSMLEKLLGLDKLDWEKLIVLLNRVAEMHPLPSVPGPPTRVNCVPNGEIWLPEDHMMRGLVWTQWYFIFNDSSRATGDSDVLLIESLATADEERFRAARLLYLGGTIASAYGFMKYDSGSSRFSASTTPPPQ